MHGVEHPEAENVASELKMHVLEQVYLPMSYVYGARGTGKLTPLVQSLRKELFCTSYDAVDWNAARNQCAPSDLYYPHPKIQDVLWWALYKAEGLLLGSGLRKKALAEVMRHVHYEASPCQPLLPVLQGSPVYLLCCASCFCIMVHYRPW